MQMNKFHFSKSDLPDALLLLGIIMLLAKISSSISDTPVFITMFVLTIWVMIIAIYLSFIENRKAVLDKWLAKSMFLFLGLGFGSMAALLDYYWFGAY